MNDAMPDDDTQLTDEQIENWRRVLLGMLGPVALHLSDEDIQSCRDDMQAHINEEETDHA